MPLSGITQPELIPIRDGLRLRKYDGNFEVFLPGYRDPCVYQNSEGIFDESKIPDLNYVKRMCQYLDGHGELYFIEALEDGVFVPIGDVTIKPENPPIAVWSQKYRHAGIGRAVMEAVITRLKELGFSKITGSTVYKWNVPSQKLHEKLGFRRVGETEKDFLYDLDLTDREERMTGLSSLCREIGIPEEMTRAVTEQLDAVSSLPRLPGLYQSATWEEAYRQLQDRLGEDPRGCRILCYMLLRAEESWAEYQKLGLSRKIYTDTMACFSRFVREHRESYGCYGFDRGFWTVRQISCKLFRIGQLEYELTHLEGAPAIGLHIPTDAALRTPLLRDSYEQARALLDSVFPAYRGAPMFCHSWLLSPDLEKLLGPKSHILEFQRSFRITPQPGSGSCLRWVFKNPDLPLEELPENTSLQRGLKAYLLSGGVFRDGMGALLPEPFTFR